MVWMILMYEYMRGKFNISDAWQEKEKTNYMVYTTVPASLP